MKKLPFPPLLATLAIAFLAATPLRANELDAPKAALESTINELLDVLHADDSNMPFTAKRDEIIEIVNRQFSFDVIIQRALGRNWSKLSDPQKEQVYNLVTDLVLQAYTQELQNGPKPRLTFSNPEVLSKSKIEIDSIVFLNNTKINLSYRLANIKDRGWQVYDVLVEGVSMVSNYRKQFDEHFQKKNASDLIDLLKSKLENA